jgi:hypothetical protein
MFYVILGMLLTKLNNSRKVALISEFGVKPASPPQKRQIKMTAGKPKLLTKNVRSGLKDER